MKRNVFRLEKVLSLREFYEEKAKIELGRCISEYERISNELKAIAENRVSTMHGMQIENNFSINSFISGNLRLKQLEAKKEENLKLLAEAELKVASARKHYNEVSTKRRVLTKLKEKQYTSWEKEMSKQEADAIDDFVNIKI